MSVSKQRLQTIIDALAVNGSVHDCVFSGCVVNSRNELIPPQLAAESGADYVQRLRALPSGALGAPAQRPTIQQKIIDELNQLRGSSTTPTG